MLKTGAYQVMVIFFCTIALVGCFQKPSALTPITLPPTATALPIPTIALETAASQTPLAASGDAGEPQHSIQLLYYLPVEGPFPINNEVAVIINSEPVNLLRLVGKGGESLGTSLIPWEVKPLELEMDFCVTYDRPCYVSGKWVRPDQRLVLRRVVDWVGSRRLWLTIRYRDSSGNSIPIYQVSGDLVETAQVFLDIEGAWDRATPVEALPEPVQTALAQTQSAYPLSGSVDWEDSRCCAGGTAGQSIQINACFSASSPSAQVSEMRLRTGGRCFSEGELIESGWEHFVPSRSFTVTLAINWVGYFISVQYRDQDGNLSPVYCDDISLEGMPPYTP